MRCWLPMGSRWQRKHANTLWSPRCPVTSVCLPTPRPPSHHIAMQRERPFEYAATSFSVRPWPMRIRPVVIVIALVAAVVAAAVAAAAASAVVVAPSYC